MRSQAGQRSWRLRRLLRNGGIFGRRGGGSSSGGGGPQPRASGGVRLILTQDLIAKLQKRAAGSDANWTALKTKCDALASGKVIPPSGDAYPSAPDIGAGYAGPAVVGDPHGMALPFQQAAGHLLVEGVVLDEEDAERAVRQHRPPRVGGR